MKAHDTINTFLTILLYKIKKVTHNKNRHLSYLGK